MDVDDVAVGDLAGGDGRAHAAAVDHGHVRARHGAVGVGAEVAEVRLRRAHDARAGGRVFDDEIDFAGGDHRFDHFGQFALDAGDEGRHVGVGHAVGKRVDGDGGQFAVFADAHRADALQFRARRGEQHVLAVLVFHPFGLDDLMGVAVEHGVDAGGVGDHFAARPRRGAHVDAQMRRGDDIVRALRAGLVRRRLHAGVEGFARVVLTEAVDESPGLVLEVGGRGRGDGLGRADAEDGDLIAACFEHHIGGEDALIRLQRHEVGRYVGEAGAFGQFEEARHAVIELMVARHGRIVAHFVHDARDILALGERAERRALDGVAHVDEQHVLARLFQRRLDAGHARVAKALADAAVYVGGKEEHDLGIGKGRVLRARERLRGG